MEVIQQTLVVVFVLGLLGATLYWLRGKGFANFKGNGIGRGGARRLQSVERLALTPQHSLHLVKVGGRMMLIAVSPGGCSVLDGSGWDISAEERLVQK
jgi:flagellar biogenesis protein FliO